VSTYSLGDAARILKVSPARLRYWERTDLVQSLDGDSEPGVFGFRDLACMKGILGLLEQGVPLRRIRRNVELLRDRLPDVEDPVRSLRIWVEGSERMVVRHDGQLLEPDGQGVLDFGDEQAAGQATIRVAPLHTADHPSAEALQRAEARFEEGCRLDRDSATHAEAIRVYREALELHADFADCHCNLGAMHYNRGERKKARVCFLRCLEIEDGHIEANFNLANLLEEDGRDQDALRHYRIAMKSDPMYPDLHINLALLYEKLGSPLEACRHWRSYLRLDGSGAWADVARQRLSPEKS
jgi:tetratricopeptide (TPR) repeat protein